MTIVATLDASDSGGFTVFTTRTEAEDAIDSMSENLPMVVVRFVRAEASA